MRTHAWAFGISAALTAVIAWSSGCGSSVTETTGGSGGNGGGNTNSGTVVTASSTSSTVTSTSVTTSATTTTSSGGGDNCMQACSHIQMCIGFDVCAQGFNLDCTNPQYDCAATCINNLSCMDLNLQSGQACLQQCAPQDAGPIDAGDPCMNACAHVQQCFGFDVCSQLGMQLDCSNAQNVCVANCISGTACNQLSQQTFMACQAQCQNPTDGGSTTDGGGTTDGGTGNAQACQMCALQSCGTNLQQCFGNNACQSWLNCIQGCNTNNPTPSCYTTCDSQNPNAKMQYQAVYACTCQSCMSQCASTSNPCGPH